MHVPYWTLYWPETVLSMTDKYRGQDKRLQELSTWSTAVQCSKNTSKESLEPRAASPKLHTQTNHTARERFVELGEFGGDSTTAGV